MKVKGISVFERHVDKAVLIVFALFLVFVLAQQLGLMGGRRSVQVGDREVPLDQADDAVRAIAERKRAGLTAERPDSQVPATLPNPVERFNEAMRGRPEQLPVLANLGAPALLGGAASEGPQIELPAGAGAFAVVEAPKPTPAIAASYGSTVDPVIVETIGPELAKLLPAQQPFDARFVSVETTFPAASFREAIAAGGPNGGAPLPAAFWQGRVEILDVELWRQEIGPEGEWGGLTLVPALPGAPSLRAELNKPDLDPSALRPLLDQERLNREYVRRPPYYPAVSGEAWTLPSRRIPLTAEQRDQIAGLQRQLRSIRLEIENLRKQPPPRTPPPPPGRRDGDPPPPPPERDRRPPTPPPGGTPGGEQPPSPELQRALDREKSTIAALAVLGVDENGQPLPASDFIEPLNSLADAEPAIVTLWAHDMTVEPGKSYRYRTVIRLTNPFFGQANALVDDQKELAKSPTIATPPSDWSEPVSVAPARVLVVRGASEPTVSPIAAPARASIELFEFYYGYWRKAETSLQPGDTAAADATLPDSLKTFVLGRNAQGGITLDEEKPVERTLRIALDQFLLDVARSFAGSSGEGIQATLADAQGRLSVLRPVDGGPIASLRERLLASSRSGENADLGRPGAKSWGTGRAGGLPGGLPPGGPGGPGGPGRDGGPPPPNELPKRGEGI